MGGSVSKEKLVLEGGRPRNFYTLPEPYNYICGGSVPAFNDNLNFLRGCNITDIVTLTIDPLSGRFMINHIPSDHAYTEYVKADDNLDLSGFKVHHLPTADAGPLFPEQTVKLLDVVRCRTPSTKFYIHCWLGRGRTYTAISYILQKVHNLSFLEAREVLVGTCSNLHDAPKYAQIDFLKTGNISEENMRLFEPVCKTPEDDSVWREKRKVFEEDHRDEDL